MGKKDKGPKIAPGFESKKQAKATALDKLGQKVCKAAAPAGGWNQARPVWDFHRCDSDGDFAWNIPDDAAGRVLKLIAELGRVTWNEILVVRKKQNHSISVSDLSKEARDRLTKLEIEDIDAVVSLRLTGAERIFVLRYDHYALPLWWDPDHKVCPSELKNT